MVLHFSISEGVSLAYLLPTPPWAWATWHSKFISSRKGQCSTSVFLFFLSTCISVRFWFFAIAFWRLHWLGAHNRVPKGIIHILTSSRFFHRRFLLLHFLHLVAVGGLRAPHFSLRMENLFLPKEVDSSSDTKIFSIIFSSSTRQVPSSFFPPVFT